MAEKYDKLLGGFEKNVFLPLEINRGTVRFRRPQFGDDLSREPTCLISFFYARIAVMQY